MTFFCVSLTPTFHQFIPGEIARWARCPSPLPLQSSLSSKFIVSSNYTLLFKNRSHEETEGLNCLTLTSLERDDEKPKLTSKKGTYYRWQQQRREARTLVLSSKSSRRLWVLGGNICDRCDYNILFANGWWMYSLPSEQTWKTKEKSCQANIFVVRDAWK